MKLPYKCQPHLCASTDETRAVINAVHLEIDPDRKARLLVTDGRRMACIPVEVEAEDVSGSLPVKAFELERAAATGPTYPDAEGDDVRNDRAQHFRCLQGEVGISGGIKIERPDGKGFSFPRCWSDINAQADKQGAPILTVAINAELLVGIQRALGCSAVMLTFTGDTGAIRVAPTNVNAAEPDARALLMPVRINPGPMALINEPMPTCNGAKPA